MSKYEVAIENGEWKYLKWDYNIEKPKDIKGFLKIKEVCRFKDKKINTKYSIWYGKTALL